jgi:glycosyltransferase involved in cell wall biosynthesis
MKIFIPFKVQDASDPSIRSARFWGPSTFALKFKQGLEKRGHTVIFDFAEDYDLLFMIVQCPLRYLLHARRHKRPIVQRLDGIFYWSSSGWKFPLLNAKATYIRHLFTDFTVYQSHYSKHCVDKFLGRKVSEQSEIIYNGVDLEVFSPRGPKRTLRDHPGQKIFFTASSFRRKDQIIPIIKALDIYKKKYGRNFKFVVAGNFIAEVADVPKKYADSPDVEFIGKVNNRDLPLYERAADVFLFTHLNPPCPNNVLEAMAVGLPICGVADGAMRELVEEGQNGLLVPTDGDAFWRRRTIATEKFADNLNLIGQKQPAFSKKARQIAEDRFSLDQMLEKYLFVMESLIG